MTPTAAVDLLRHALMEAFWISLPLLLVAFAVGLVVSLLQTLTSLQDGSVAALPKLAAVLAALFFLLPWMLARSMTYMAQVLGDMSRYAR